MRVECLKQIKATRQPVLPDNTRTKWRGKHPMCSVGYQFSLRYLFAAHTQAIGEVLGIIHRAISTHLIHKAVLQLNLAGTRPC